MKVTKRNATDLDSKPIEERLKVVLGTPFKDRPGLIVSSKDAEQLTQMLPDEELWLTIKEVGEEASLQLLEMASQDQLQYILDIELWKKDEVASALKWLKIISTFTRERLLTWARSVDGDLLVLLFKKNIHVRKRASQDEDVLDGPWPSDTPPTTLEGVYYLQGLTPDADAIARPMLELMGKLDHEFYARLCEAVIHEIGSSLEESALSWRERRLAEKGFPSIEEALGVYAFVSDRRIADLPKRGKIPTGAPPPRYPLMVEGEIYPILMLAISKIEDDLLRDSILREMVATANKVVIADGRQITPEVVLASLNKVLGYVNIALELLAGADIDKAARVLRERWIVHLFQIGWSQLVKLHQRARRSKKGTMSDVMDPPIGEKIACVSRKRPMYFSPEGGGLRDFKGLDEIRDVERAIGFAGYVNSLLDSVFNISPEQVEMAISEKESLCASGILLTAWAKGVLTGRYQFGPLSAKELGRLLRKAFGRGGEEGLKSKIVPDFKKWFIQHQPGITPNETAYLDEFVDFSFVRLVEELGGLSPGEEINPEFIQCLWVVPEVV